MNNEMIDKKVQFILVISIPIIVVLPVISYISFGSSAINIFSVITSSLLTLALVLLYYQQYSVLEEQTKLVSRDYESMLSTAPIKTATEDEIFLNLKNIGRGNIMRMYLHSEIISDTGDIEIADGRTALKNTEDDVTELGSGTELQEFSGRVRLRYHSEGYEEYQKFPFKTISKILSQSGIESCILKLELEIVDEATIDSQYSYKFDITEQELEFKGIKETTIENDDREEIEKSWYQSTTVEEGIKHPFSTRQDINKKHIEEVFESGVEAS